MARYIDVGKALLELQKFSLDTSNPYGVGYSDCLTAVEDVLNEAPTADVAEVKHGKWHILPDDPYDESGVPTEEGWYRIITADGQETTDYFFNKPTMCEHGITYWKNARSIIRAWAKMDGGKEE